MVVRPFVGFSTMVVRAASGLISRRCASGRMAHCRRPARKHPGTRKRLPRPVLTVSSPLTSIVPQRDERHHRRGTPVRVRSPRRTRPRPGQGLLRRASVAVGRRARGADRASGRCRSYATLTNCFHHMAKLSRYQTCGPLPSSISCTTASLSRKSVIPQKSFSSWRVRSPSSPKNHS